MNKVIRNKEKFDGGFFGHVGNKADFCNSL
jgi:hypothetical protein